MRTQNVITVFALVAMAACDQTATTSPLPGGATANAAKAPANPTATWSYPLNDAGLGVRSDHLYSDGTSSTYANGVCGIATTIFVYGGSGDATLNTGAAGRCVRHVTYVYPDGVSESMVTFNNLRMIQNSSYSIPIGQTVARQLHMGSDGISNNPGRCGGLIWGYGVAGDIAAGSDSVLVTRVDARTWHVTSQAAPHNLAYCKSTGQLFAMPVDFTVSSSAALP